MSPTDPMDYEADELPRYIVDKTSAGQAAMRPTPICDEAIDVKGPFWGHFIEMNHVQEGSSKKPTRKKIKAAAGTRFVLSIYGHT